MQYFSLFKSILKYFIIKILPVKKKRLVFTSFNGHYSDSPKYIAEKIHQADPTYEIVWLIQEPSRKDLPAYALGINIDSWKALWYRGTAVAIIDNVYGEKENNLTDSSGKSLFKFRLMTWLKTKRKQQVFTTWHGTPLKCMGRDQIGNQILDFSCPHTTMLMGNRFTLEIMQHLTFRKIRMELIGTPRNDLLCMPVPLDFLRKKLNLPADKKIALFAPTFRNNNNDIANKNVRRSGLDQLDAMDFDQLFQSLSSKFGGEWLLICRFHYHVEALVDWNALEQQYPGRIINGNLFDDMAEYLACTDLLLTDASSSMFDYALTGKPCFLFFPDLDYYEKQERGFYSPVSTLPFPIATNFEVLLQQIQNFDETDYHLKIEELLKSYGFADTADSSERVANYIFAHLQ